MMTRHNYWSCSKFADWLRGTPKLHMGTSAEWSAWKKAAKTKKVRYWLAEEGLDFLQAVACWPSDRVNDARHYINNRWISKTHALTSQLRRGQWHELDTRLLHALFDELINFVEIDQANLFIACSEAENKKYKTSWYRKIFGIGALRCPEAGLADLEWASGLKHDEDWVDKESSSFGQPTTQALAAQEILALYNWWKVKRPQRPDPTEASGWSAYCEEKQRKSQDPADDLSWIDCDQDEADREYASNILEISRKMEQEQEDEDTEMLIRLIKIRGSLWT